MSARALPEGFTPYAWAPPLEAIAARHGLQPAAIIRCNPNNPTGELVEPDEIAALARSLPNATVVVDEAYYEYGGKTVTPLIAEMPNLVVLRTLSKAFGLAALRVGYAVASPEVARDLD